MDILHQLAVFILSVVSDPDCPVCRVPMQKPLSICNDCLAKLTAEAALPCPDCGKPASQCLCGHMNLSPMPIFLSGRTWLAHTWYLPVGNQELDVGKTYMRCTEPLLLACKKRNNPALSGYIADRLAADLSPLLPPEKREGWYLTYPPRSEEGYQKYGFDQCEEIAKQLGKKLGIPVRRMLKRTGGAEQKKMTDIAARAANMVDAFTPRRVPAGCRVLLLDDIITTGSTIRAAGNALVQGGARAVFPIAYATTMNMNKKTQYRKGQ